MPRSTKTRSAKPEGQAARRVALYARTSREDASSDDLDKRIQSQIEFLRSFGDLHGLNVVGEYLDDDVTGTIALGQRPEGARLLADARAGMLDVVVFLRVSRLGRRLAAALDAYDQLDAANVAIQSATEPIDTSLPIGRFIFQMLASFAELDRETIIENTSRGRARGARQGRWYGVVPTGYTVADGRLVPNEREILPGLSEAELVRDIFRRVAEGTSSVKLAGQLTALGLRRFKRYARHDGRETVIEGAPGWPAARVAAIVKNPIYKGLHTYEGRHGDIERDVTPLVDEALWDRANARLQSNRIISRSGARRFYLLSRLLTCASCGVSYIGTIRDGGVRVYRCGYANAADRGRREPCRSRQLMADRIEADVWAVCERFIRDPGRAIDAALHTEQQRHEANPDPGPTPIMLRAQLATKATERADILTLLRRGAITLDEAEQQLAAIAEEQATIQTELDRAAARQAVLDATRLQADAATALLEELRCRLDAGLDDETRRLVVQALVRRIVVHTEPGPTRRSKRRVRIVAEYAFAEKKALPSGSCSITDHECLFVTHEWVLGEPMEAIGIRTASD